MDSLGGWCQGTIDWFAVAANCVQFAFIKATEGGYAGRVDDIGGDGDLNWFNVELETFVSTGEMPGRRGLTASADAATFSARPGPCWVPGSFVCG